MNRAHFSRLSLAPLFLSLVAVPLTSRAQRAVTTAPVYPTDLNPALAVPAGTPVPDGSKLPAVPIPAPPVTLPVPVAGAAVSLLPVTAISETPIADPSQFKVSGGIDPARRAAATPTLSLSLVATPKAGGPAPSPQGAAAGT